MNPGTGKVITAKKKLTNNLSTGTRAKGIISSSKKVYIDPTVTTQEQADARAAYLAEEISYRLGSLECTCPGLRQGHGAGGSGGQYVLYYQCDP